MTPLFILIAILTLALMAPAGIAPPVEMIAK
jgi:hypothetical protein